MEHYAGIHVSPRTSSVWRLLSEKCPSATLTWHHAIVDTSSPPVQGFLTSNVARQTAPLRVAGIHVEHTVDDRWAGSVHGTATGRNAIHCGIVARRVHLPKQPCVASGIGA